ncbi:RICIN domain-containing protein [soil metagenome]
MKTLPLILCSMNIAAAALAAVPGPDFGPNVVIVDPTADKKALREACDRIFKQQERNQFGSERYAILFKPGSYDVDLTVGFYTQVAGLGKSPEEVVLNGQLQTLAWEPNGNVTQNFWRSCENMTVKPGNKGSVRWAVSQAAPMRRMHIAGDLVLFISGWSSGGFLSDSKVDGKVIPGSQQQWISRNCDWGSWNGGVWNMFFLGVNNAPAGSWPSKPFTVEEKTPIIREKPYLYVDRTGNYGVFLPGIKKDSKGHGWQGGNEMGDSVPIAQFYIAHAGKDTAASINAALAAGKNLLLTPGVYQLDESLKVTRPNTVVLGLGFATLVSAKGNPTLDIADVDGVKVAGLLLDAGEKESPYLIQVGEPNSAKSHAANPTYLWDVFCRVGGAGAANTVAGMIINSNDVIGDHAWIWRADHGAGAGWNSSKSKNGLIVNGANVTYYGLFVEHFQEYQTVWNGENGRLYFYQSELPYDVPSTEAWSHNGTKGWASYKVADNVKKHQAEAMGIYSFFRDAPVISDNAVEAPKSAGIQFRNVMTFWLDGAAGSSVEHVISGTGDTGNKNHREVRLLAYP